MCNVLSQSAPENMYYRNRLLLHQTVHFFAGFIGEPAGHFQSEANSGLLEKGPITRNLPGEWLSSWIVLTRAWGVLTSQWKLAAESQNNCDGVKPSSGRGSSSP